MKQSLLKKLTYIVCCTMAAGAVGATAVYAANEGSTGEEKKEETVAEDTAKEETVKGPEKQETVYVIANAYGIADKVIVSDWLKNNGAENTITEESILDEVKNVKGDETYTQSGDSRTWNAKGNDIYYQGTTGAELPVKMKISYKLDGKEINAEDLAGKSGKVTIRFDFENTQYVTKTINGEETRIYVPFAAITGVMLDNDRFGSIEVTNAKTVNDGSRTFVVGTAFPGISESLGVKDSEKVKIPEYFEITADVKDFSLDGTITAVTNEVFNDIDLDLGDKESDITENIDKLSDAMNKIVDGSGALYDGLSQLLDKSGELAGGVSQLKDGAKKLDDGASQLYDGSVKLTSGLEQLTDSNETLTMGSRQVFQSLIDMANKQLEAAGITGHTLTIENYGEVLDGLISSLDEDNVMKSATETARKQIAQQVEANRGKIEAEVTKAVRAQVAEKVNEGVRAKVLEGVLATQDLTLEAYQQGVEAGVIDAAAQGKINAAVDAQMQSDAVKAQAEAAVEQQMQTDEVKAIIEKTVNDKVEELIGQNLNSDEVQKKIKAGLGEAKAGAAKLIELKAQLDSYNKFYTGLAQYTDGVAAAADGAVQIKDGLGDLSKGTGDLYAGIAKMDENMPALTEGITKLADGSKELADGCSRFNEEGVGKVISLVDGDLGSIAERFKAVKEVSADYQTFTGGNGSVKFIYRTAGIESES